EGARYGALVGARLCAAALVAAGVLLQAAMPVSAQSVSLEPAVAQPVDLQLEGAGPQATGLRIEPVSALSVSEAAATEMLVAEVLERLPPRWRAHERALRLSWRDDLPADVHGRIRGERIALSRVLLD